MPKFLEDRLKQEAAQKGLVGDAADRYVYGAMNKRGYMRGNKVTAKGNALQATHNRDVAAGTAAPRKRLSGFGQHPSRNLGKFLHPKRDPY